MEIIEKSIETLNDLIEINNDRIAGFEKAANDLKDTDPDLKSEFETLVSQSRGYASELTEVITRNGGQAEDGSSVSGSIHRTWLDVKATFTGHDRKSILAECERGEDAIKKAYQSALAPENELSSEFSELVIRQQQGINASHDRIKALRDSQ